MTSKPTRKAKRAEAELRALVRTIVTVMREADEERCRLQAAEQATQKAQNRADIVKACAELAGFPRNFGVRMLRRGMTVPAIAWSFSDASELPLQ